MTLRNHPEIPLPLRCRQLWNQYGRTAIRRHFAVMRLPQITRRVQAAGLGATRPLHYTDGFCLRLYGDLCFLGFRHTRITVTTHPDFQ